MHSSAAPDITQILVAAGNGDAGALDEVFTHVYGELRRIAHAQLRRAGAGHSLNTTAVVHEVYLRLVRSDDVSWNDRGHFYAVAARAMRQILLNRARMHLAQKRGAGARVLSLDQADVAVDECATELIELDDALTRLSEMDERLARVVNLRFFAGLTVEETAQVLGVTDRTVKRDWRVARAFLHREMGEGASP
jgi:RNA polymerase sigma factor (TIGR02999 family)